MLVTETFSRLVGRSAALIEDGDETAAISTLFRCLEETASVIHPSALKGVRIILPKVL